MNCDVCQDLIQQRLDGLEPADQIALQGHLHGCPSCRTLHACVVRFQQGLRLLAAPELPDGLTGRIAARLREDYLARRGWRRRLTTGLAVAAAVLLLLSVRIWQGSGEVKLNPVNPVQVAKEERPKESSEFAVPPSDSDGNRLKADLGTSAPAPCAVRESVSDVGSTMVEVATRTADVTVAESRLFLPLLPSSSLNKLQLPAPPTAPAQVLREAGEEVSESLAPVAESPRRALDLFLRELPPMDLDGKTGL